MEVFGVNAILIAALSIIVLGLVEWFKIPIMPTWAVRLVSLVVSYAVLALTILVNPMTWQMFIVSGAVIFLFTNGIWHTANSVVKSVNSNVK